MKTSRKWSFRFIAGKVMLGLVLAAMIGSISVAPALGKDNQKRMGKRDNGRYVYVQGRRVYQPYYGYRERVYVPPRVIYAPPPPPGIGIFFPPIFIRP